MSGGKSAHSFYPAPGIYHLRKYIDFFTVKLLTSDEAKQGKEQKNAKDTLC